MNHLEATTPQLKLIDQVFEGYRTLDLNNSAQLLSKTFVHRTFPKTAELPDQTKEEHLESFGPMLAKLVKIDVCSLLLGTPLDFPG